MKKGILITVLALIALIAVMVPSCTPKECPAPTETQAPPGGFTYREHYAELSSGATIVVSTYDSKHDERADYICGSTSADVRIEEAIAALPTNGGTIVLMEGTYNLAAALDVESNLTIIGQGPNLTKIVSGNHTAIQETIACTNFKLIGVSVDCDSQASSSYNAIDLSGSGTACANITIEDVKIWGAGEDGINLYGADNCVISNAEIWGCEGDGIEFTGNSTYTGAYNVVTDCYIYSNGDEGILTQANQHELHVTNCDIVSNTGYGVQLAGNYCTVQGNYIASNTAGGISDSGTGNLIVYNTGYVTEKGGSSTIANGQTTANVTHGLATTPTVINITFKEDPTNAPGDWWVTGNATHFTVTVTNDPGASGLDFWYEAKIR